MASIRVGCVGLAWLAVLGAVSAGHPVEPEASEKHDYCIIGAGPGGLQLGFFLQERGRDYVILEQSGQPGDFFSRYPRRRRLISINKRFTNNQDPEFRLRHDWNSLLSNSSDLLFTKYSKLYYPSADEYVAYLSDYTKKLGLNVVYHSRVDQLGRSKGGKPTELTGRAPFLAHVHTKAQTEGQKSKPKIVLYECAVVTLAIGMGVSHVPRFRGSKLVEPYGHVDLDPARFEGTNVLILGKKNAAFEMAEYLTPFVNHIHMISSNVLQFSFFTHYVGDLRAINSQVLDQYQLVFRRGGLHLRTLKGWQKSLDGLLEGRLEDMIITKDEATGRLHVQSIDNENTPGAEELEENFPLRQAYDHVIACTGFRPNLDLFSDPTVQPDFDENFKYPEVTAHFESINVPDLYFGGAFMHVHDVRKSSGGFIHGFRYLTRALHAHMDRTYHHSRWSGNIISKGANLTEFIIERLNTVSSLYQMFGVLCDVMVLSSPQRGNAMDGLVTADGVAQAARHQEKADVEYIKDVAVGAVHELAYEFLERPEFADSNLRFAVITLEYHKDFKGPKVLSIDRAVNSVEDAKLSRFLHPVIRELKPSAVRLKPHKFPPHTHAWLREQAFSEHHVIEDFLTEWNLPNIHIRPLRAYLRDLLRGKTVASSSDVSTQEPRGKSGHHIGSTKGIEDPYRPPERETEQGPESEDQDSPENNDPYRRFVDPDFLDDDEEEEGEGEGGEGGERTDDHAEDRDDLDALVRGDW